MASIKNFGIQGVGSDVQFGKGGNRLVSEAGTFRVVNSANVAVKVSVANAVADQDAVALSQLTAAKAAIESAYQAADAQLSSDISNVATTASQADAAQQILIDALRTDLSAEANARSAADLVHDNRLTALEANATQSASDLAAEIDRIETAVGLNADGTYKTVTGSNYLDGTTSVAGALSALDAALHSTNDALIANAVSQQTAIDKNAADIAAEVTRATTAEGDLQEQITAEVTRATDAESALANSVLIETIRAQGEEAKLANAITAEVARATAAEETISNAVTAEVARATAAEDALRSDLEDLDTKVNNLGNVFEYKGALDGSELALPASAGIGDYYKVTGAGPLTFTYSGGSIVLNTNDGVVFNGTSWDKIDNTDSAVFGTANFTTVTGSADVGYTVDIAQQFKDRLTAVENATSVDTADLQAEIDALEQVVADEKTRQDGINAAQNEALAAEANARSQADTLNAQAISNEANARTAADTILTNNLANAVTAYQAADAALQLELDNTQTGAGLAANGNYVVNGSSNYLANATSLADADNKLDAAIKSVATNLANLSQDEIRNSTNVYAVKTTASAVEFYGDKGGVKTLMGNVVTGAAQDSIFQLDVATAGEIRLEAQSSTAADVDIRLVPQGGGQVVVGETGTNGVIQADDGFSLTLAGGDKAGGVAGDLILAAGAGTTNGKVLVKDGSGNTVVAVSAGNAATNAVISGSATAVTFAADGSAANVDVVLAPKGTGSVDASNHKIVNVSNATVATDAVNLGQLQAATTAAQTAATAGSHRSVSASVTEAGSATVALGSIAGTAVRVKVVVTTGFSAGATLTVTDAASATLVAAADVDEAAVGMYIVELAKDYGSATALTINMTKGAGATGVAKVYVEYISA